MGSSSSSSFLLEDRKYLFKTSPVRNLSLLILVGWIVLEGCSGSPSQGSYPSHPQRPVEIRIDRYGIPHIRGESLKDISFAQGYVQAEFRLAQIENIRLLSQGRRSEVFGKEALNQDILIRALNFYGFAQKEFSELRRLYPEIAQNFEAFAKAQGSLSLPFARRK